MFDEALLLALNDKNTNVCFTGPRPYKLPGNGDACNADAQKIAFAVSREIEYAAKQGKLNFLSGLMAGFDILAAEQVLLLKKLPPYNNIRCILVGPFRKGFFATKYWTPDWIRRARNLCEAANFGISLYDTYYKGVYYKRNQFLVSNASQVICFYNGASGGGTAYTLELAHKAGLEISNVCESMLK